MIAAINSRSFSTTQYELLSTETICFTILDSICVHLASLAMRLEVSVDEQCEVYSPCRRVRGVRGLHVLHKEPKNLVEDNGRRRHGAPVDVDAGKILPDGLGDVVGVEVDANGK